MERLIKLYYFIPSSFSCVAYAAGNFDLAIRRDFFFTNFKILYLKLRGVPGPSVYPPLKIVALVASLPDA